MSEIDPGVRREIEARLDAAAEDHGIEVLFAAESGSRAWGFPSPDSDYDVRFIYRHRADWYLSVREARDVIEYPIEDSLDVSGWDLRKALRLALKSNPALYEWLVSPIVYGAAADFTDGLREIAEQHYSRRTMARHYLNIVRGQWRSYFGTHDEVKLKKYFYCLRPLCAVLWMRDRGGLPPMNFSQLLDGVEIDPPTRGAIDDLLAKKAVTKEMGTARRIAIIDGWIDAMLAEGETYAASATSEGVPLEMVDEFYRRHIGVEVGAA